MIYRPNKHFPVQATTRWPQFTEQQGIEHYKRLKGVKFRHMKPLQMRILETAALIEGDANGQD